MVTQLITRLITGEAGLYIAKLRRMALLYAILGVLLFLAVGFLFGALFVWIAHHYGGFATSLGFAFFFLLLALAVWILAAMAGRRPTNRADDRLQRDIASIAGVAALSNAPLIFSSVRRRRSLLLIPAVGGALFGIWRLISATRPRT